MINYADLAYRLAGRHVKDEALMPYVYSRLNPKGRYLHDDWPPGFRWIPRRYTTYLLPAPAKWVDGPQQPEWTPYQAGYPLAPGAELEDRTWWNGVETVTSPWIKTMAPVPKPGEWGLSAVWLDGKWRTCYYASTRIVFGRRLYTNRGLKMDWSVGDYHYGWPEASLTLKKLG